ncbi:hypothetical protein I4U23_001459 [Adineta vaga]|nr:hypothetical protein I4U23_001459 [Adineta vaga]
MATTEIIETEDFTKQGHVHNNCSSTCQTNQLKSSNFVLQTITEKEQEIIPQIKSFFNELQSIKQVRIRSLSHWQHLTPTRESMADAGWFSCNTSDRVICIYCNTICHEWTIYDDPFTVHAGLAPQCPFVLSISPVLSLPKIINDALIEKLAPVHPVMTGIARREETFSKTTWPTDAPSVDELVRAGFFYSGVNNIVTCFYCNGSLHKWGPNDKPIIEHARWFPNCIYAKHLCGEKLYGKIQSSKKRILPQTDKLSVGELAQIVSARLDLPIVKRLQSQYQLNVIKRCIEDQFKVKNDDFASDIDLTMACLILKKQIDHIKGCRDKIITPSKALQSQNSSSSSSSKQSTGECLICLTEEKQLACMPCGHLCACVSCGYALRTCPICRQTIQCFVRINS